MSKATDWYKDLEGKEILWENCLGERCPAIVTGIDYYLGYTIQAAKDYRRFKKGAYLTCYRGPMSPIKNRGKAKQNAQHRKVMSCVAKMIREEHYVDKKVDLIIYGKAGTSDGGPSASGCVFAQ